MKELTALLGVDAGTSGVKVCAFTLDGALIRKEEEKVSIISERPGYAELDVMQYWLMVRNAISRITAKDPLDIVGIGLSTTCPTVITMDQEYHPIGRGITYLDNRASAEAAEYLDIFSDQETYVRRIGNRCSVSTCSSSTMRWIRKNESDRWDATTHIGMLNSFLAAQLTGSAAIDTTQASYSGIFRLENPVDWDDELLELAGIPREKLLPISQPSSMIGGIKREVAEQLGLKEGTPVAIGSGGTAAAAYALGLKDPQVAFESVGTSGVFTFLLDEPRFNPSFMNRCHVISGLWLSHGASSMMGGSIEWLKNNILKEFHDYSVLDTAIHGAVPGAHGVVFLPYLSGERCPVWDPDAKAVWYGMSLKTTSLDLLESVFEAGAYSLRQIRENGERFLQNRIDSVIAVGNGTKSEHWNQMKADVLSVPYRTTAFRDASAYGAAIMGGVASGIYADTTDRAIPVLQVDGHVYHPRTEGTSEYERGYRSYLQLYPAVKDLA
ncbi:MAG: hypothetical protein JXK93_07675 [Sphaerochaetaceae bacterium]|nr:hypothetical protein [Sphaerochaetaceae bacterium]